MTKNKIHVQKSAFAYDIQVAPNQKVIKTQKVLKRGYILDIPTNRIAQKNLKPTAYVLYMHLLLNHPDYEEALSLKNITENTSLSERTYYSAVNELIDKGYLRRTPNSKYSEYYILLENTNLISEETQTSQKDTSKSDEAIAESI